MFDLWKRCQEFVGEVCATRDASHGLAHMQQVTELALLIHSLHQNTTKSEKAEPNQATAQMLRIILVGMLHDVNDHKYDHDGSLNAKVEGFVQSLCKEGSQGTSWEGEVQDGPILDETAVLTAIDAISYSKEKKRGMRWFEAKLPSAEWVYVRDIVSDADKCLAIGVDGLERCFHYNVERLDAETRKTTTPSDVLQEVRAHADEKLLRLKDDFIVTVSGKFMASRRHTDLEAELIRWEKEGVPSAMAELLSH